MGKKKSRTSQTSKGEIGNSMKTRLRHGDEGYASQRIQNQLTAFLKGKRVMLTIENPNKNETNRRMIRVPAGEVWKHGGKNR
tara:strand:- start:1372 stop:1617 length:246 start_codon:yes stop_codon:yes gene_type:complete